MVKDPIRLLWGVPTAGPGTGSRKPGSNVTAANEPDPALYRPLTMVTGSNWPNVRLLAGAGGVATGVAEVAGVLLTTKPWLWAGERV